MKAVVYKSTGSWYTVKTEQGQFIETRIKGKFRLDGMRTTNPVAVGDIVHIEMEEGMNTAMIVEIEDRKNYIIRQSPRNVHLRHIISANVDQALLICSCKSPRTPSGFIDRFTITAEMYHIPVQLIFNKKDIYKAKQMKAFEQLKESYEAIGYPCMLVSAMDPEDIETIRELLDGKVTLFSGQSGVGKSSLINGLQADLQIKTKEVSRYNEKGLHTTTFATMYDLESGGQIIDTPGIKELALVDLDAAEVSHYYPEMRELISECRFNNCLHINEPDCAVKLAVESGKITDFRYQHYEKILWEMGVS